ncbi:hypothetical protein [Halococcoides cellulosivorans]|uniref:Lipoprotein n=1 Tax=Halococcoides cellulosivorans TaxID=1679096 RepID=A0A2R4X117_9EURY|nr:hypothetical protein [Halococcoides cellulosivorans]AWB27443.1 hypothetical protein HARCEL1_06855 [Halococcoides cellulosivorans]
MDRRRFLALGGVGLFGAVAGCLDRSDGDATTDAVTNGPTTESDGPTPDVTLGLEVVSWRADPSVCTVELMPASDGESGEREALFAEQVSLQPNEALDLTPHRNGEPVILTIERDGETLFEERIEPQEGVEVRIGSDGVTTDWTVE